MEKVIFHGIVEKKNRCLDKFLDVLYSQNLDFDVYLFKILLISINHSSEFYGDYKHYKDYKNNLVIFREIKFCFKDNYKEYLELKHEFYKDVYNDYLKGLCTFEELCIHNSYVKLYYDLFDGFLCTEGYYLDEEGVVYKDSCILHIEKVY